MMTAHRCRFLVSLLLLAQTEPLALLDSAVVMNREISSLRRRRFLALPWLVSLAPPKIAAGAHQQESNDDSSFHFEVTVSLPKEIDSESLLGPDTALYVTARPTTADGVPASALQSGRIPPVLTARSVDRTMTIVLTDKDRTEEGRLWDTWKSLPLAVSARLDTDGIAATRNSTDLVGRAIVVVDGGKDGSSSISVPLQGRGLAGKLLTK